MEEALRVLLRGPREVCGEQGFPVTADSSGSGVVGMDAGWSSPEQKGQAPWYARFPSCPAAVVRAALGVGEGGLAALAHLFSCRGLRGLDPESLLPDFPPLGHRAYTDF